MRNTRWRSERWRAWRDALLATRSPPWRSLVTDGVLGGAAVVACLAFLSSAFGWGECRSPLAAEPALVAIATLAAGSGVVRRRPEGALAWQLVRPGEGLAAGDTVYVPPDTSARVHFKDGAVLEMQEAALVVIGRTLDATRLPRVDVVHGTVAVRARRQLLLGARGHRVRVDRGRARLDVSDGATRVSVADGDARLEGAGNVADLHGFEAGEITASGSVRSVTPPRVHLQTPEDGARLVAGDGAVTLHWDAGAASRWRVEVAEDADFRQLAHQDEVRRSPATVRLTPGVYHWRVSRLDSAESAISEQRTLSIADPRALVVLRPSEREEIDATEETTFSWTSLAGAEAYRVEVGRDAAMRDVAFARETVSNSLRERTGLDRGQYWWRVGASLEGAIAAWSEAKPLRVGPGGSP